MFVLYSLLRLLFLIFNWSFFDDVLITDFITGLKFDAVAIALWFLPFHIISIIGIWWDNSFIKKSQSFFLLAGAVLSILLSVIDFKYFQFTLTRTTAEVSHFFTDGGDIWPLIPQFLIDFWYLFFVAALVIYAVSKVLFSTNDLNTEEFSKGTKLINLLLTILILGNFVLMARGGIQLIPLKIIDATLDTKPQNIPLVLNTPFTFIKTLGKPALEELSYYPDEKLTSYFTPIHKPTPTDTFQNKNVIVITLESFSNEFIRSENKSYLSPFFNSLKRKSLSFENCFANGKKSIEGIPSIYSGVPSLSEHPIITGIYGGNKLNSFATYLKPFGYHTSFFHGGRNGTMSFDSYILSSDFDLYFGFNEYPNQNDFDGTWGIYDEPYFDYFINTLNGFKEPFFSGIFTLSSHHPYSIPKKHIERFNKGSHPMENAIAYADYALNSFFEKAKKQPWFERTLFVITADHTPNSLTNDDYIALSQYSIPFLLYSPNDSSLVGTDTSFAQQTDILPTVLDYLNYPNSYFAFGNSKLSIDNNDCSIQYLNGVYQYISEDYVLHYTHHKSIGLYHAKLDKKQQNNLLTLKPQITKKLENNLRAYLQQYNNRMINNQLSE